MMKKKTALQLVLLSETGREMLVKEPKLSLIAIHEVETTHLLDLFVKKIECCKGINIPFTGINLNIKI